MRVCHKKNIYRSVRGRYSERPSVNKVKYTFCESKKKEETCAQPKSRLFKSQSNRIRFSHIFLYNLKNTKIIFFCLFSY